MTPKISIITPVYNSEQFIEQTIYSILKQTFKNWELLLIDDGSKDQSVSIIEAFIKTNTNIKLIKNEKNEGAAISRNKGIELAKGDYITFLDADDLWKPEKLEKQLSFMQRENCDVSYSSYELIDEEGNPLNKKINALPVLTYSKLLKSNYVGNLTGMYHAKQLGKITSSNLRKRQDWLLWLNALKASGKPSLGIQEPLAYYRIRKDSMSSNKVNLLKHNYQVYKKGLGYSTFGAFLRMLIFLKEHFFVKSRQTSKV